MEYAVWLLNQIGGAAFVLFWVGLAVAILYDISTEPSQNDDMPW
jgi:hypothetical protein